MNETTWTCASCGTSCDESMQRCGVCGGRPLEEDGISDAEVGPQKGDGSNLPCLRCHGTMRRGFVAPRPSPVRPRNVIPTFWHEGKVEFSILWGHVGSDDGRPVVAYRCDDCGRLEFFAE
ncbi:MAG: hypothetical protein U0835_25155 [Isosphaeraceae bacterium]